MFPLAIGGGRHAAPVFVIELPARHGSWTLAGLRLARGVLCQPSMLVQNAVDGALARHLDGILTVYQQFLVERWEN
jgi:hypothetical protein